MGSPGVNYRECAQSAVVWRSWCQPEAWKMEGPEARPTLPVPCPPPNTAASLRRPRHVPLPAANTTTTPAATGPGVFPPGRLFL